ncbi:hypothetical protein B0H10DRAFT_2214930 [Mycena sp. CBHHK59/15]|nr:hypothetical protein B0H10DRAFT_2214930 [Mycena sp. CBHHK59/15]
MSTFCADELQHALAEESSASAIKGFHVTDSAPLRATASVTLLEGRTISIALTTNGYSIAVGDRPSDKSNANHAMTTPSLTFESIEQLLLSVSTLYQQRRQEALIAALERVSA